MLISVDLPAPFSPTMPVMAPLAMASDTPRTACTLPNDLWMPESSIAGAVIMQPAVGVSEVSEVSDRDPGGRGPCRPPTYSGSARYRASTPATNRLARNRRGQPWL